MPATAERMFEIFKAEPFVKRNRNFHFGRGFEANFGVTELARLLQTLQNQLFAQTQPARFGQQINFDEFANVGRQVFGRENARAAEHFIAIKSREITASFALENFKKSVGRRIEINCAGFDRTKFRQSVAHDSRQLLIVTRFNRADENFVRHNFSGNRFRFAHEVETDNQIVFNFVNRNHVKRFAVRSSPDSFVVNNAIADDGAIQNFGFEFGKLRENFTVIIVNRFSARLRRAVRMFVSDGIFGETIGKSPHIAIVVSRNQSVDNLFRIIRSPFRGK